MNDSRQEKNPKTDIKGVQSILFCFKNKSGVCHKGNERILESYTALGKPNTRGENEGLYTEIVWQA